MALNKEQSSGPGVKEVPINVNGSSTFGRYPKISVEKTFNMFESDGWLVSLGGYEKVIQFMPTGEGRGCFQSIRGDFSIVVINANVYQVRPESPNSSDLVWFNIGQLTTFKGEVSIDENLNQQICIVDGVNAYIYNWNIESALVVQADTYIPSALKPNYVTFHDNFFLFGNGLKTGASTFWYVYQYSTATTISFVSTQAFQVKPDYPLAIKRIPAQSSNVLVFGEAVCEVHTHIGDTINYRRNSSISIDYGCLSTDTIAASDNYICWLAANESNAPVIMIFDGQKATPISSDGIDFLMGSLLRPDLSTAFFFRQDGHLFYQLTFYYTGDPGIPGSPADNLTLLYDLDHKKFYHASDQFLNYHPARNVVYFNNDLFFVSLNNASFYRWDTSITQIIEDVAPTLGQNIPVDPNLVYDMQRIRICETVRNLKTMPFVAETFYVTMDQGNDLEPPNQDCIILMITEDDYPTYPDTRIFSETNLSGYGSVQVVPEGHGSEDCPGQVYQPKLQLSISKDGGETWSRYVDYLLNTVGNRKNILKWDRMGLCNEWTPKLRIWSASRVCLTDGMLKTFTAGR